MNFFDPGNIQVNRSKVVLLTTGLSAALVFILLAALRPLSTSHAAGSVYCVVPPGSPTGPFTACDQVFTSVQEAVDSAVPHSEVWIASGVYTDVHEVNGRYQIVSVDKSLTLRGGYTPPFSSLPDPETHVSLLDAQGAGRVIYITGPISVTVAGLNLTGGQAGLGQSGSGLYAADGEILLQDNVIYGNQLNAPSADSDVDFANGGGVYVTNTQAILTGNTIHYNIGYGNACGGGVAASKSDVTLRHNTVSSNTASLPTTDGAHPFALWGGGLCLVDSQVVIVDNDIYNNVARQTASPDILALSYGGGLVLFNSSGTVEGNRIVGNQAGPGGYGLGGGVYIQDSLRVTLTGNLVQDNVASSYDTGSGGGIAALAPSNPQSVILLHDNRIVGNTALISGTTAYGGGVFMGTAMMTLTHNVILSNTAIMTGTTGLGGGLMLGIADHLFMEHNLVMGNAADKGSGEGHGGGVYLAENIAFLTGNIIRRTTPAARAPVCCWMAGRCRWRIRP